MTPRDFSADTVQVRLVALRELLSALEDSGVTTAAQLEDDLLLRLAVERILTQLVEISTNINQHLASTVGEFPPGDYKESFLRMAQMSILDQGLAERLSLSVGLRNVLVHEYLTVNLDIVAAAVPTACVEFSEYVRQVASWLSARQR